MWVHGGRADGTGEAQAAAEQGRLAIYCRTRTIICSMLSQLVLFVHGKLIVGVRPTDLAGKLMEMPNSGWQSIMAAANSNVETLQAPVLMGSRTHHTFQNAKRAAPRCREAVRERNTACTAAAVPTRPRTS